MKKGTKFDILDDIHHYEGILKDLRRQLEEKEQEDAKYSSLLSIDDLKKAEQWLLDRLNEAASDYGNRRVSESFLELVDKNVQLGIIVDINDELNKKNEFDAAVFRVSIQKIDYSDKPYIISQNKDLAQCLDAALAKIKKAIEEKSKVTENCQTNLNVSKEKNHLQIELQLDNGCKIALPKDIVDDVVKNIVIPRFAPLNGIISGIDLRQVKITSDGKLIYDAKADIASKIEAIKVRIH